MAVNIKSVSELEHDKIELVMNTVAWKASIYRENPDIFVRDVLGIHLYPFQCIVLNQMFAENYTMFIGSRGLSKTFLTALFCCCRCILYPKTKIVVTSGTLKQANLVLEKIQDELIKWSPFLANEILDLSTSQNNAHCDFKNGSWIITTTSSDNSRGLRANILIVDEFRKVDPKILSAVLKKFLSDPRHPKYLDLDQYDSEEYQERNKEIYMSSAWFKSHWSYEKFQDYLLGYLNDNKKYFVCTLPYQVAIKNKILMRSQVLDEMTEETFNDIIWKMEMECKFYSDDDGSLFRYDEFEKNRTIKNILLPLKFYNANNPVPNAKDLRIGCLDIALMESTRTKHNDASSFFIADLDKVDGTNYQMCVKYGEAFEGLTTDELGIIVMRYFYKYHLDYIVIDTNGRLMPPYIVIYK